MNAVTDNSLTVEFCDERTVLSPTETMTFGRCGDLFVDENPFLHRIVGEPTAVSYTHLTLPTKA